MDKQGLLNPHGLWNKRGAWLGGAVAGGALIGFNYFYFEEMLAALVLFIAVWLPLLLAAFLLATFELAGESSFVRLSQAVDSLKREARRLVAMARWDVVCQRFSDAFVPRTVEVRVAEARTVTRIDQARRRLERACGPAQHGRAA
ncbi:MAG: hypothetical protein KGL59_05755 [Acidobacteriota bacterium]|nr:hypothetical protein [Acidobacteriota bacterium]